MAVQQQVKQKEVPLQTNRASSLLALMEKLTINAQQILTLMELYGAN